MKRSTLLRLATLKTPPLTITRLMISTFVSMMFLVLPNAQAATITSTAAGGTWGTASTWVGGVAPAATDSVVIASGAVVTTTANRTCAGLYVLGTITISTNNTTLTVNGGFGGTGTLNASKTNRKMAVTGNWTFNGTSTGVPTVTFNGTGNQTFTGVLAGAGALLIINKTSGSFILNNALTVKTFTLTAGTVDPQTFLLTATTRTFTAGTLRVGAGTWAGNYSGAITQPAAGIIEYYAGAQTINNVTYPGSLVLSGSGVKTFQAGTTAITGNLTLSGTATATTVVNMTVGGNLSIGTGSTLTTGNNFTLGVTGTTSVTGTLALGGTGAKTFTGAVTVNTGGIWNETGVAAINFANGITNNGTFTANTGVHTFQTNAQALTGTFSIPSVTVTGITLTNNNSLTVATTLTGTGGLTMASNSSLVLSGTTTVTTLTANTNGSTVTYNGGASQTIKSASYQDLVVNNTFGTLLGGAATVEGNLTMTAGNIDIAGFNLTVIGNITGASSAKYIKTSGAGRLVHTVTSTAVTFPVGNSTYNPYIITNNGTSDSYGVRVLDVITTPAPNTAALLIQRYWDVSEGVAGGSNLSMTAQWNIGERGGSYAAASGVKYGYHNGSTWTEVVSSESGTGPYTANSGSYNIAGTDITGGVIFAIGKSTGFLAGATVAVSSVTTFGNQCVNTTSVEKTYTVSGANLGANIVITPPANYEISLTSGSGFVANPSTITLSQSSGYVNATTIYVRFKPTVVTTYNSSISHNVSSGSNNPNLAVAGSGVSDPPTVTTPTSTNIGSSSATLGGNLTALGCATVTEQGIYWSTTSGFANGTGTKVSNTGTFGVGAFTVNVSGLNSSTTYYYKAFATNSIGTTYTTEAQFTTSARSLYSIGSGNFNATNIWSFTSGGASCGCAPIANDAVFIEGNNTITISASPGVTFTSVNIASGSTLNYTPASAFTLSATAININGVYNRNSTGAITGTISVNSGGKYIHAVNNVAIPTATWNANSTLEVTGVVGTALTGLNRTFGNVVWNCPSQTVANMPFPDAATMTIAGSLTISSTNSGGLLLNQATLSVVNFTQSAGTFNLSDQNGTTRTLNISGNYSHTGGTLQQNGGNTNTVGAIIFNGTTTQTFNSVGGTLSGKINYTVNAGAIVDFGVSTITNGSSGAFNQIGTATLITQHAQGFSSLAGAGAIQCTGARTYSSTGNYVYNGTIAQATGNAIGGSGMASLTINNAAGVTLSNAITLNSGGAINIGTVTAGSILNDGGFVITTTSSTLNMTSGTFKLGTSGTATTLPTFSTFNLSPTTTIEYASGVAQLVDVTPTYQNITLSGAGQKTVDSNNVNSTTLSVAGNLTTSGGVAYIGSLAAVVAGNIAGSGNITLNSGTINIQGNWTNTGSLTAGTSSITFDGSGSQLINSVATTYYDLSLANTGNKTMGAAITVNGDMDVAETDTFSTANFAVVLNGNFANPGIMNGGSSAITIGSTGTQSIDALTTTGSITVTKTAGAASLVGDMNAGSLNLSTSGGTLNLGSVLVTISGNITIATGATLNCETSTIHVSGTACSNSGTLNTGTSLFNYYNSTGGQVIIPGTYYHLTCNNTSGTDSVTSNITVNGILRVAVGGTLNMRTFVLLGTFTTNGLGTITTSNTSAAPIPSGKSWSGTVTYAVTTGAQTIAAGTYNNLILSNTSNTNTTSGSLVVNGALTTSTGGTLNLGTTSTLTGTLNTVTNNGTITTSVPTSTSSTPLASGKTWNGTIIYNSSTGAQTVVGGTYNNVTISGTSGKDASASVTINGILNLQTANASATKGAFDLPTGDTLFFGVAATTTGSSDVTGLMVRNHTFTPNITYPFGNPNQRITFENEPGQTIPSNVMVRVSLLSTAPTWANQATKRLYQVSHTGGSGTRMSLRINYLDGELAAGVDEGLLSVFSRTNGSTVTDLGWANYDGTANFMTITGVDLATWPTNLTNQEITLATTTDSLKTWNGSISTDWTEPRNWTPNGTPARNVGVIIPDATTTPNDPSIPVGAVVNSVVVRTGGILNTLTNATITLFDNDNAWAIETGATFNPGNSTVTFAANRNQGQPSYTGNCMFYNLTVSDSTTITVLSNVTANISGTLSLSTTGILDAALFNNTVEFSGSGNITIPRPRGNPAGYRNLIISGSGTKTFPDTLYIAGNLTNNGTVSASSSIVVLKEYTGLGQTIGGSNNIAFSNLIIGNGTPSNIAINTNITVSGTMNLLAGVVLTPAAANTIGGSGTLTGTGTLKVTRTAATADFVSQYSIATLTLTNITVDYMGTANQSVNALNYANLTISGSSTRTVTLPGSSVGVSGVFSPTGTNITYVNTGSTIDFNGSGSQTIPAFNYNNLTSSSSGSRTLASSGTIGVAGVFTPGSNSYTVTGSTVDFNGTAQSIPGFTYNNVTLSNSGTKTAAGNLAANGILNIASGITLDMTNAYTLGGGLTGVTNNGTITTAVPTSTSNTPLLSGRTWGGTVVFNSIAAQTVPAGTYTNITMSGAGLKTLGGDATVNDIIVGGTSGLNGSNYTLDVKGTWTNNATFTSATGTVSFSGSSAQTLSGSSAPTFNNLTIDNASGVIMSYGITVGGVCSLTNGTLTIGANTLTLNGTVTGTGSFVGGNTSSLAVNGTGALGTVRFTTNTNLLNLTINRTSSGTVTLGSNVSIISGGSFTLTDGVLDMGANTVSIATTITRTSGAMNGSAGNLIMNGSAAQTIPASLFTSNTLAALGINNTAGVNLGGTLLLTDSLKPTAGTLTTGGYLTLVSNAIKTARIANGGCTTCSYISGNVTVQRYIPAVARKWRFMGSSVSGTTLNDWKNEIYITGIGGASNGFDATASNQASVYGYNETLITGDLNTGWEQATNITNSLVMGKGYRVFIRGDRSDPGRLTGTNATQNAVTMDLVGPVYTGDITMPVSFTSSGNVNNDGWCLLANPYPCQYDWNAHYDAASYNSNVSADIWILNAQGAGYESYNANSDMGGLTNGIIPPGASFWVKATAGSPILTFKEQFKVGAAPLEVFKTDEGEGFSIRVEKDSNNYDRMFVKYMDASTAGYDNFDTRKLPGTISISSYGNDNVQLAANARPTVTTVDTIKLNVSGAAGSYKLIFNNSNEIAIQENLLLMDSYMGTATDLSTVGTYSFDITAGVAASQGLNRFYIIVGNSNVLPVKLLTFKARKAENRTAALGWSTAQESNNSHFDVQRSVDGITYETIGTVKGNGNTSRVINYNFIDTKPNRINYYRLKQVDFGGIISYSQVQLVNMDEMGAEVLTLYPNPVVDEVTYSTPSHTRFVSYVVYDIAGVEVLSGTIPQQLATLRMGALSRGVYVLTLKDEAGNYVSEKLIKE